MIETRTTQYLVDITGLSNSHASKLIKDHAEDPVLTEKKVKYYLKSDLDEIAREYIEGIRPMQPDEWDSVAIAKHFGKSLTFARRLVLNPAFPPSCRAIIGFEGKRRKKLWKADKVKKVSLDNLSGIWESRHEKELNKKAKKASPLSSIEVNFLRGNI
jgi:hypothetical protein